MLTKAAYKGARVVVYSPDFGPIGKNPYWKNLLEHLVVSGVTVARRAIFIVKKDKKPLKKPQWK